MIDTADPEIRARLLEVLGVRRVAEAVAARGPYSDVEALAATADAALAGMSEAEVDEAVVAQPGSDAPAAAAELPAAEQAGLDRHEDGPDAAVERGRVVYQDRFGRPFLVRTTGRSQQDVLDELQRRLKNDPAEEAEEVKQQLREIAGMRLRSVLGARA